MTTDQAGSQPVRDPDQKFCFACGGLLHISAPQCPKCGAAQPAPAPTPAQVPAQVPAAAPVAVAPVPEVVPSIPMANQVFCRGCGVVIHKHALACPKCGAPQQGSRAAFSGGPGKDRITAALLAFFLGGIGGHKFYLGQAGMGILYLLFFWTFIPAFVALIEGIIYLTTNDADFRARYP